LLVKEFEPRATRRAALVVDSAPREAPRGAAKGDDPVEVLDRGCTLAVSLLEHLVDQGERPEAAILTKDEVLLFAADAGPREVAAMLEALARLEPSEDPGFRRLIAAALPSLNQGARVYVVTARDPAAVRHALERADARAAFSVEVLPFASEADVAKLYAPAANGGSGLRASGSGGALAGLGGNGSTEREPPGAQSPEPGAR
jgi:uncharacterized protein (DUF58 family)